MKLYNDYEIPDIAFGTGVINRFYMNKPLYIKDRMIQILRSVRDNKIDRKLKNDMTISRTLKTAITSGYIFFDTGRIYGHSEKYIGDTINRGKREDYFVLTKISDVDLKRYPNASTVMDNLSISLKNLQTEYVDAYLLHFPHGEWVRMYRDIEMEYKKGRAKSIGVCNFDIENIEILLKNVEIKPMICQVEIHPLNTKKDLIQYCKREGIVIMAHTPTGHMHSKITSSEIIVKLTEKYNKSIAQVIYKWHIQNDVIPIVSSTLSQHIKENLDIYDFELTERELLEIDTLNENFSIDKNNNKMNDCPEFIYNV